MTSRTLFAFLLAAGALLAADWSGKWVGTMETVKGGPGAPPVDDHMMVLIQSGVEVTGTAGPREKAQWALKNVRLNGANLTFDTSSPGGVFVLAYELEVKDGVITGRVVSKKGQELEGKLKLNRAI